MERELFLGHRHFEESDSETDYSDEDDSDDDGAEPTLKPTEARCVEEDARAAEARRVQFGATKKARELEAVRVAEDNFAAGTVRTAKCEYSPTTCASASYFPFAALLDTLLIKTGRRWSARFGSAP